MTAKQKANQARFKKVVAEAKKLRKKNPKLTQAQAVKQAWAMMYSKKDVSVGNVPLSKFEVGDNVYSYQNKTYKAPIAYKKFVPWESLSKPNIKDKFVYKLKLKDGYSNYINEEGISKKSIGGMPTKLKAKKAKRTSKMHTDTKSHNVNIRVVSGIKVNRKPGKIGALPVDFTGSVLGLRFRVYNQFNLDGTVTLQVVENTPGGDLISNIDGRTGEVTTAAAKFWGKIDGSERKKLSASDEKKVKKTIQDFLQNLHKEVKQYNSGKDTRTKKGQRLNVKAAPKVSKGPKDQIKDILRTEKKRLKYGYTIVPGRVINGIDKNDIVKKLQNSLQFVELYQDKIDFWKQVQPKNKAEKDLRYNELKAWNKLLKIEQENVSKLKRQF